MTIWFALFCRVQGNLSDHSQNNEIIRFNELSRRRSLAFFGRRIFSRDVVTNKSTPRVLSGGALRGSLRVLTPELSCFVGRFDKYSSMSEWT